MTGLIIGSGLSPLAETISVEGEATFAEAGLPTPRVPGHGGRLIFGQLAGQPILIAEGRVHLYEGWTAEDVTASVRWMAAEGVKTLVLTNAAGCLNPHFRPGYWMMISDHLNLTGQSPLLGGPHFVDMSDLYSASLREEFQSAAAEANVPLLEGVYAGVVGPQYETPAEVRMLRTLGADAVGMSTVLEAIQGRQLGLEVAGFSCLTNWATGLSDRPLDHDEVVATSRSAVQQLARLFESWGTQVHAVPNGSG
jgi:purine-nucleoside phosphorylase